MNHMLQLQQKNRKNTAVIVILMISVIILGIACLFAGSSNMSFSDALDALARRGTAANVRIIWKIRVPRVLAAIIAFAGGFLSTGNNLNSFDVGANPYATSLMAFLFATVSILLILALCSVRSFSPNVVVLAGIAIGSVWTAATTILQFYATDVGLSAAVIWNFGDLGRATSRTDCIMLADRKSVV